MLLKLRGGIQKFILSPLIKHEFVHCGKNVYISRNCIFGGINNISVGNDVSFGPNCLFYCTRAPINFGNHIILGPNVSIITGDHRIDIKDKPMSMVTDNEKKPENDLPVIIDDDVWIGANATILKGVHIHTGAIVAAGALVVNNVPEYSIVGGVPAKIIGMRFE